MKFISYPFHSKKILFLVAILAALIVSTGTVSTQARAETTTIITTSQSSIAALLQELYAKLAVLQQELAQLKAAENGGCFVPTRTLAYGVTGTDVETLQNILGQDSTIYPSNVINGIFDINTQSAVQIFQFRNGIVTGGSPSTTGFGVVGPHTTAFFQTHCFKPTTTPVSTGLVYVHNAILDDSSWNISSMHENELSFTIDNKATISQYINYTVAITADSSSNRQPSAIIGSVYVSAGSSATVHATLNSSDFNSGNYHVQITAKNSSDSSSQTISLETYTSSAGGGGGGSSSSGDDISIDSLSLLTNWDTGVTATNTLQANLSNSFSSQQTIATRVVVQNTATGVTVLNLNLSSVVPGNSTQQLSVPLTKSQYPVGSYSVTFTVDPDNTISEANESNNTDSAAITVTNSNPTVFGVYRVYSAIKNPQLFFTNAHITQASALTDCKSRVAADTKVWCTWNNVLIWGTKPIVQSSKPNIIYILTDDLDLPTMSQFPKLKSLMTDRGMTFLNHFDSLSLCCPSRAAGLCGEYGHNTGVLTNAATNPDGTSGAYNAFMQHGDDQKTMAVWLQNAGYKTALMGKYLNGYDITAPGVTYAIPKGWSEWDVPIAGNPYSQYNYTLNVNGKPEEHYLSYCTNHTGAGCPLHLDKAELADKQANFMINVINTKAKDFITRNAATGDPFFLYVAPYTPHGPATPAPRYEHLLTDATWLAAHPVPKNPSFNEADISDKPSWLRDNAGLLQDTNIQNITTAYHKRVISMYAVEDLLASLIDTLTATGELDNTYIVFTSDNGFHLGEHRLTTGKLTEFDTDLRIPLIVRGPGITPNSKASLMTGNVDIAPTLVSLAGLAIPSSVDGRSFKETLLGGSSVPRKAFLIEHADPAGNSVNPAAKVNPTDEPRDTVDSNAPIQGGEFTTAYEGIRTPQYTYVHYAKNNEEELYDDIADPYQLNNIITTASTDLISKLRTWTNDLSTCQGATCRSIEAETRI